ncbi:MAG: RNHCP domain-containing protein [Spirochaetaceae bacterium]|nr:RNHCP domain-containing protein [Spirochaetaceae bacterium]
MEPRSGRPRAGEKDFTCAHCGVTVPACAPGTNHRNHCSHCLWSLHVDVRPGDRAHLCCSPMEPIAIWVLASGERRIVHRCTRCGVLKANRVAGDDDDTVVTSLAGKVHEPVAQ